jgi:hypothetical protein
MRLGRGNVIFAKAILIRLLAVFVRDALELRAARIFTKWAQN